MAHKKAAGTARNLKDSPGQRLGIKKFGGQVVKNGNIILRQRGTRWRAGEGVLIAKDHSVYAIQDGYVHFTEKKRQRYDGRTYTYTYIHVVSENPGMVKVEKTPKAKPSVKAVEVEEKSPAVESSEEVKKTPVKKVPAVKKVAPKKK